VPAPLGQSWVPHAQAFYAFEVLGVLPKVHRAFFDAIHRDRLRVDSKPAMEEWLKKNGVELAKFEEAVRSFSVQNNVRKAARMVAAYQINGVPTFAVQGRYTIGAADVGEDRLIDAVDQLVGIARRK
jgi:thiol:disulfide interchange protein DsbA